MLLKLNNIPFDFIILLQQPEDLIIKKALSRKTCEPCNKTFNSQEFISQDFHLKNIHPQVKSNCPICNTLLATRKDDSFRSVKKRFFQFSVFHEELRNFALYKEKIIFFDLFKGVEDLSRLVRTIDDHYDKLLGDSKSL